ncbi:CCA tRNA nucleotidyltransferase [Stigmatella sp. ncwal1]|uniref:CCA tRNA nucleotidyltransferase n=1 Tax=Stigmatella ashevillensis TaxID=2995309 RepID=A0ABT5DCF7_9BACT|nr:CCA tRNA nucleotidyltransferase [Stigmatella ashevillena]MDC0711360.1 CCA tRNA nucleotidyltransferase [Stigmatella ashevillena]
MSDVYPSHPIGPTVVRESLEQVICQQEGHTVRIQEVIALLQGQGVRVFVAGGACRDWLTGAPVKDVDLSLDRPVKEAHAILRQAFPGMDPVLRRNERFGTLSWGDAASGGVDLNILRSHHDIQNDDMWTTSFVARQDLREDALTRDFSMNAFYYPCHEEGRLWDPLGCGLEDLQGRVLRLITHPRVLSTSYRTTFRIIQFLCRGYVPAPNIHEHLERFADHDIQGMGDRLLNWLPNHLGKDLGLWREFRQRLSTFARQDASRKVLDRVFARQES